MRDELKTALQARWEESLGARAAIDPGSPVPLLDELLAPHREATRQSAQPTAPRATQRQPPTPVDRDREDREKMISQIPPKRPEAVTTATRLEPALRASDLARYQKRLGGAKGTRTPDPLLAKNTGLVRHGAWRGVSLSTRPARTCMVRHGCYRTWLQTSAMARTLPSFR